MLNSGAHRKYISWKASPANPQIVTVVQDELVREGLCYASILDPHLATQKSASN